jgi:hypothetical protein
MQEPFILHQGLCWIYRFGFVKYLITEERNYLSGDVLKSENGCNLRVTGTKYTRNGLKIL